MLKNKVKQSCINEASVETISLC